MNVGWTGDATRTYEHLNKLILRRRKHEEELHQLVKVADSEAALLQLVTAVGEDPGYHAHHYITIRLTMR